MTLSLLVSEYSAYSLHVKLHYIPTDLTVYLAYSYATDVSSRTDVDFAR